MKTPKVSNVSTVAFDAATMPEPQGWHILCAIPKVERRVGSILLTDEAADREQGAAVVAQVVRVGTEAYNHPEKFRSGPWCREGDYVILRSYSGVAFRIGETEFRIINDDQVQAVCPRPDLVQRS